MNSQAEVKVWDPLVRLFHWSLVVAFALAYATAEDEWIDVHVIAGYVVLGLVVFRILWGVIGPKHARFGDFVRSPAAVLGYLRELLRLRAPRYLGHNPAGGMIVVMFLVMLLVITLTGMAYYGVEDSAGPLAGLITLSPDTAHWLEEVHEFAANFTVALVALHVCGVVVDSFLHHDNLVKAMVTGKKREA
jgi:cytochrome b